MGRLTLVGFADVVLLFQRHGLGGIVNVQGDLCCVVEAHVAITEHVEDEGEVADLWGRLELHLEGLDVVGRLAGLVEDRLVECGECEGWHGHLTLLGVCQEDVPARGVVTSQVRGVRERRLDGLDLGLDLLAVLRLGGTVLGWFASHQGLEVVLVGINVLKVGGVHRGHGCAAGRNEARLDYQLYQTAGGDDLFAHNLEENSLRLENGKLLGDSDGVGVLLISEETSANGQAAALSLGKFHVLLDGEVLLGIFALHGLDNSVGEVGKLEEGRRARRHGLDEVLGSFESTNDGSEVAKCESNSSESFSEGESNRSGLIFF